MHRKHKGGLCVSPYSFLEVLAVREDIRAVYGPTEANSRNVSAWTFPGPFRCKTLYMGGKEKRFRMKVTYALRSPKPESSSTSRTALLVLSGSKKPHMGWKFGNGSDEALSHAPRSPILGKKTPHIGGMMEVSFRCTLFNVPPDTLTREICPCVCPHVVFHGENIMYR